MVKVKLIMENILEKIQTICPVFKPEKMLMRTGKCYLLLGEFQGIKAVTKYFIDSDIYWKNLFLKEIQNYQNSQQANFPVKIPHLLFADSLNLMMVLEWIDGYPLCQERYISHPLSQKYIEIILKELTRLHQWKIKLNITEENILANYKQKIDKYTNLGFLTDRDFNFLYIMLDRWQEMYEFNHGDILLKNILATDNGLVFIDWEFAGLYLPGYDFALLWTILYCDPYARDRIIQLIEQKSLFTKLAFMINQVVIIARELKIHSHLEEQINCNSRIAQLNRDLNDVRQLFPQYCDR